jgi:hypothetical protein
MRLRPEVYVNPDEPLYGVLVSEATVSEALEAVRAECASDLPIHYLGIKTRPILNENEQPGRKRRFYVFTDEPQGDSPEKTT